MHNSLEMVIGPFSIAYQRMKLSIGYLYMQSSNIKCRTRLIDWRTLKYKMSPRLLDWHTLKCKMSYKIARLAYSKISLHAKLQYKMSCKIARLAYSKISYRRSIIIYYGII